MFLKTSGYPITDFGYDKNKKTAIYKQTLRKITACGGLFVSVMPRTWKEDKMFRDKVREGKIKWVHLLSRPNNRKPKSKRDRYYLAKEKYLTSNGYRLLWILSTQKAGQDDLILMNPGNLYQKNISLSPLK